MAIRLIQTRQETPKYWKPFNYNLVYNLGSLINNSVKKREITFTATFYALY